MKKLKDLPIDEVDALTYAQECFDALRFTERITVRDFTWLCRILSTTMT